MIQDQEFFQKLLTMPSMNVIEFYDWYDFDYYPSIQEENALFQFNNNTLITFGNDYKMVYPKLYGIFQK